MDTCNITYLIQFIVPFYVSLFCCLLLLKMYMQKDSPLGSKPLMLVVMANTVSVFLWLSIIAYLSLPDVYLLFNSFILLAYMLVHVLYYHFIFELTKVHKEEKFPVIHYLFPILGFLVMLIWSFLVPYNVQLSIVKSGGKWVDGYLLYSAFFTSKAKLFFVFNLLYACLGLYRIIRYRKVVVNYSADEQRASFRWIYQFLFAMLALFPMTIIVFFFSEYQILSSGIALYPVVLIILKDIVLVHNILLENYVIMGVEPSKQGFLGETVLPDAGEDIKSDDIRKLETYMRKDKPYLNPKLKITDMILDLNTNRTSLSVLINRTYGMNFCRYINRFRLEELEKLQSNPQYENKTELELVEMAGFSDYRGYRRVKQKEEFDY